jgi:hypothetical protein
MPQMQRKISVYLTLHLITKYWIILTFNTAVSFINDKLAGFASFPRHGQSVHRILITRHKQSSTEQTN